MNKTSIEWTDFSSNIIKYRDPEGRTVHGCVKVSAGCANCYASAISKRFSGGEFTASRQKTLTPFFDEAEAQRILRTRVTGKRVFIGDMTDVFGEWVPDELLDRVFAVMALTPQHTYQVLTKRPERMRAYLTWRDNHRVLNRRGAIQNQLDFQSTQPRTVIADWPLPNVWLGTSVENQEAADERIPHLLATPAAVRFLSCEPLIDEVRFDPEWLGMNWNDGPDYIRWVIVGGESGPGARPCDLAWIRGIVAQCKAAGVPAFVKQAGSKPFDGEEGFRCDGEPHEWAWLRLRDRAGRDMAEWPEDLRVREYPR